jgi:hypothetical protein
MEYLKIIKKTLGQKTRSRGIFFILYLKNRRKISGISKPMAK